MQVALDPPAGGVGGLDDPRPRGAQLLRARPLDLALEIGDDGRGGADPANGSGLRGLADRVAALGGSIELDSPEGEGTTLRARLPVPPEAISRPPA